MSRYTRVHNQALATRIEESDGLVFIREEVLGDSARALRQSSELIVGVLYRLLGSFMGTAWKPHSICFMHSPSTDVSTHMRVFGMPVRFNQGFDGIICRSIDLERPLPTYDPAMARQVRDYLDTLLVQVDANVVEKVRQLIVGLLPLGICSVDRIAEQMGVDRRTVHDHLSRHGKNYSEVLDSVRTELAKRYIDNRERSLSEVATLLGFSSLSAFSRWFAGSFRGSATQWRVQHAP